MKKIIICILLVLSLCGCASKSGVEPVINGIAFNLDITYYNENYSAEGKMEDNILTLTVKSPSELEGMVLIISEDSFKVNYKGLTFEPTDNALLPSAGNMIYKALSLASGELKCDGNDKNLSVSSKTENGEFVINLSPAGLPIDLKYLSGVLNCEFSGVTILKNE